MAYTADSPILASPQASPEQCARFMLARPHGEYTDHDIAQVIVPAYFAESAALGADPVLLIAQLIHESGNLTSWWSQRPRRNPAGIGVTGQRSTTEPNRGTWSCRDGIWFEGVSFPTWKDDAIPAHIGRLLAYAIVDQNANPTQHQSIQRALSYRPLKRYRGEAPTLRGLAGRWAVPGTSYPDKLATIANAMARM